MTARPSWTTTPITDELLRGHVELETTEQGVLPHRLPAWARAQSAVGGADGQLAMAEAQPSGVRLLFRTSATAIELDTIRTMVDYVGSPLRPAGQYDLVVDGTLVGRMPGSGGRVLRVDLSTGSTEVVEGPVGTIAFTGLPAGEKDVELWLPYAETTELVSLRTDAPLTPAASSGRPVWLHHGSSISHGSVAESPTTTWPALAAAAGDVELVNLGFGGSALLDPFTARTMRDLPADLISVKIGINLVNLDLMRLRAFVPAVHGFLDTIRDGHPDTPLLVVSPIYCPIHEHTPGPGAPDFSDGLVRFVATGDPREVAAGKLTLTVIREHLARIVAARASYDPNISYLDGLELYGEADHEELPLPDQLHPDPASHRLIGERFGSLVFGDGGAFASR
ncbi:SGNH/GDSL hydrolase family protein [Nocardioides sp. CN2-186]|uniref:GDSL-type esterase/lipase family protein n=1 Tax=Nocardioides tweenelious TaxID=3156607 RepID=UPI0032B3CF2A